MSKLIDELMKDHVAVGAALQKIRDLGIGSMDGQAALAGVKSGLLAHLKKEDEQLYPVLKKEAARDAEWAKTLDILAKDMDVISKSALDFFAKYANGGSGIDFAKDFGRLYSTLSQRISKEERILYAKYDEISAR